MLNDVSIALPCQHTAIGCVLSQARAHGTHKTVAVRVLSCAVGQPSKCVTYECAYNVGYGTPSPCAPLVQG